ncbi:MAG: DegT/DnrJ/EryC1/StrS family aminotransferase [Selenomonadaceae bacterium]|nr:DegT/DnrJ/EryC1/StrS family aminotransferase [Selenomonadaceae bacterium]
MLCFKDGELDTIARQKGWLGINKDTYARSTDSGNYKWRYHVDYVGEKYHGNSIMASIALVQLKYLDRDNAWRAQMVRRYRERLSAYPEYIKLVTVPKECQSSNHLFQIIVNNRDELILWLNKCGVAPGVHYVDNTNYPMYSYAKNTCPNAAFVSEHVLSLPLHMDLTFDDVQFICDEVIKFVKRHDKINLPCSEVPD